MCDDRIIGASGCSKNILFGAVFFGENYTVFTTMYHPYRFFTAAVLYRCMLIIFI